MVGSVFEYSFQNIKWIAILSFVEGVMAVLVKRCQFAKTGKSNRLDVPLPQQKEQVQFKNYKKDIFKSITEQIGKELGVESYMIGKVFEYSFQNIK